MVAAAQRPSRGVRLAPEDEELQRLRSQLVELEAARAQVCIGEEQQFFLFGLGEEAYALGVSRVREVVAMPALLAPSSPAPGFCGWLERRGELLPVLDLAQSEPSPPQLEQFLLLCEAQPGAIALRADRLLGLRESRDARFDPLPTGPGFRPEIPVLAAFPERAYLVLPDVLSAQAAPCPRP